MNATVGWTPARAIEKYLDIRETERVDKKLFEERARDRQDKMSLLENYLLLTMSERGEEQIKTGSGTAYKSPQMRCTMTDREEVIKFTLDRIEKNDPNAFDLFTNHINKEAVKVLLENKVQPPGVDIQTFVQCNIRKA